MKIVSPGELFSLTSHEKEILRSQVVDENGPGAILRDFETLLRLLETGDAEASGKWGLLPMKLLPQINQQLTRPIEIDLQRPQQRSYPHINGLYLLLRGTGLLIVDQIRSKRRLRLDNELLKSWRNLNATEQYFTLFEVWLLHADPEILGEHEFAYDAPIMRLSRFFYGVPPRGLHIAEDRDWRERLKYSPGLHNVALLDLFGMIEVEDVRPPSGKGWNIVTLRATAFGFAILKLVHPLSYAGRYAESTASVKPPALGQLQPIVQPFFPEWRENLVVPESIFRDGIHVFKVTLEKIWLRVALPAQQTLEHLGRCIPAAFGFDDDHLYRFSFRNRVGSIVHVYDPRAQNNGPYTDEVAIGELPLKPGTSMTYLYDFGDNWEFDVRMERIDPPDETIREPVILKMHGEAPTQYPEEDEWEEWDEDDG